jgi:hypothetical protein
VRRKGRGITGDCQGFKKNRGGACCHVAYYCRKNSLPVPGPYILARRLEPFQFYHGTGQFGRTRTGQALEDRYFVTRDHLYALCAPLRDPRPGSDTSRGQPRIPYRALVYAFLLMVIESKSEQDIRHVLFEDRRFRALAGDRQHYKTWRDRQVPLSDTTLSQIMACPLLREDLEKILVEIARTGRKMDKVVGVDASGFGTSKLGNWFVKRYASDLKMEEDEDDDEDESTKSKRPGRAKTSRARKRDNKGFVKVHTFEGLMSGFIYAINCTLDFGEGSADTRQFQHLVDKGLRAMRSKIAQILVADKAYWKDAHFGFFQRLGLILMVMIKEKIKPENAEEGREMIAFMEYLRLEHPAVYRAFYRYRQRVESAFSAQKRTTGHIRTKVRKDEWERLNRALPTKPPKSDQPRNYDDLRHFVASIFAREMVGEAHINVAYAMAIGANLRKLIDWQYQYREDIRFYVDAAFEPMRRVYVPWAA